MVKKIIQGFLLALFLYIVSLTSIDSALALPFTMNNVGTNDVSGITAEVTDITGGAQLSVVITGPVIGDITGIFFDLAGHVGYDYGTIDITGGDVTKYLIKEGQVKQIRGPGGPNMGGSVAKFDVGVQIGSNNDDIQSAMISIIGDNLEALDFTRIGIRVQSVGVSSGSREGSAKYIGTPGQNNPVPEPATMILLGFGLVGIAGVSRKKYKK